MRVRYACCLFVLISLSDMIDKLQIKMDRIIDRLFTYYVKQTDDRSYHQDSDHYQVIAFGIACIVLSLPKILILYMYKTYAIPMNRLCPWVF